MSQAEAALPPSMVGRLVRTYRGRDRGLTNESGVSLLLHALLLFVLLLALPRHQLTDAPQPAGVALVLEGGATASTPQTQESRRSYPSVTPDATATEPVPPSAITPPMPPSHPGAVATPATPRLSPPQAVQEAPQDTPRLDQGLAPLTLPPPHAAPRPPARPRPVATRSSPQSLEGSLSAPMDFSLSGAPPPASAGHLRRGITMTMAPTEQNRNVMTRYAEARKRLGEDWWAAFSKFVEDHKYYPQAAADAGEDGDVVLHLTIARDGSVRAVSMEFSSGSPRLDMAWESEFRGAMVPAFPAGTIESQISFSASMHYILERE